MLKLADTALREIAEALHAHHFCTVNNKIKQRHPSRGAAEASKRSLIKRGLERPENGRIHVYQCPKCRDWHVGHTTREESC